MSALHPLFQAICEAHGLVPPEPLPERCPTCGQPVASIFDHVDRDEIDPETGFCREPEAQS